MKSRCYNENHGDYKNYGSRGIIVCDRWKNSFENFLTDMGERPEGMTIDRIDVNGNYEPDNCKWLSKTNQARNRTSTKLNKEKVSNIKYLLETNEYTNKKIAEMFSVSVQTITDIKKGRRWSNVEAEKE